ncbi:hypothetical protein C8R44DRAFT_787805, partial [Mycena epipterygia]
LASRQAVSEGKHAGRGWKRESVDSHTFHWLTYRQNSTERNRKPSPEMPER